jgi:hypothetical protein
VLRSDKSSGEFKKIGETKSAAYIDKGLAYQKVYYKKS